jgi:SAM-dependent methyltransferase
MDVALVYLSIFLVIAALLFGLSRQLGRPSGWFGRRVMGKLLNQGNQRFLDDAVEALAPAPGERIVDVGFGGGCALDLIRERVAPARPAGVKTSAVMLEQGRARWGDAVDVHLADVAAMPFQDASLDGVLSVHTIYFWRDPVAALREIRRVLRPDGRLVLGLRRRAFLLLSPVTWFGFRLYSARQLEPLLRTAGFAADVREKARGELIVIGRPA